MRQSSFARNTVPVSAISGEGMDKLLSAIQSIVAAQRRIFSYQLDISGGQALAWLYAHGKVLDRMDSNEYINLRVDMDPSNVGKFRERFGYQPLTDGNDDKEEVRGG